MDRTLWSRSIDKVSSPRYPCPECRRGALRMDVKSMKYELTAGVQATSEVGRGLGSDATQVYVHVLVSCPDCGQGVAVAGDGGVDPSSTQSLALSGRNFFLPKSAHPMPEIFAIPTVCPKPVKEELHRAFSLFWSDPSASANRIRSAVEILLDELGVSRRARGKGELKILTLHQRLQRFAEGEPENGSNLLAVKWLGNAGSHGEALKHDDLLDALEIVEHVLQETLTRRSKRIAELARKIERNHAPRPRAKQRRRSP